MLWRLMPPHSGQMFDVAVSIRVWRDLCCGGLNRLILDINSYSVDTQWAFSERSQVRYSDIFASSNIKLHFLHPVFQY